MEQDANQMTDRIALCEICHRKQRVGKRSYEILYLPVDQGIRTIIARQMVNRAEKGVKDEDP
jgi:hypothetical protein